MAGSMRGPDGAITVMGEHPKLAGVYDALPGLTFDRPADAPGVLRITMDAPGLNAVSPQVHRELADVWLTVDRDPDTRVALLQGAGRAFSAGGSFELLGE